ncbi:MAG: cell division protein ZapE [Motiliproteus sp.]|nr:cell division protein ZapE [Motiliproteus sp.]MCW9054363.1 cell division protein ZapE [Motiliproteus sp.]
MPITARYHQFQKQPDYQPDPAQLQVLELFEALEQQLLQRTTHADNSHPPISGLYLWGSVGRGKTLLMDLFFEEIDSPRKLRLHFHRFMQQVHQQLFKLSGTRNPLQKVADHFADRYDLLCFDEFFVSDIADAMILGTLTDALYQRGMVLVLTSNQHPDNLYKEGVQRDRFMPAISNLKQHNQIFHLDGQEDHRFRPQQLRQCLLTGNNTEEQLQQLFPQLSQQQVPEGHHETDAGSGKLEIEQRRVNYRKLSGGVAWFDFQALCDGPRSQNDYIFLAKRFHTLLISDIPALGGIKNQQHFVARGTEDAVNNPVGNRVLHNDDRSRRFISLIDELYDHGVKLYASLEVPLDQLYLGGHLEFEFQRTLSRLVEMQSDQYLQQPHRPE